MKFNLLALVACTLLSVAEAATGVYTVKAGDTLYGIVKVKNINMQALKAVNPELDLGRALQVGQVLRLPTTPNLYAQEEVSRSASQATTSPYTVKTGDTISGIARVRNINMLALEAVNPKLDLGRALQVGQVLRLPITPKLVRQTQTVTVRTASIRVSWTLPVRGVITTPYFGTPEHAGIDIAAPLGTPIQVSRTGTVTESRFDPRTGWGWTIVINYGGGALARYSHNQMNLVRVGDTVQPGQVIARLGSTGNSTGPHVDYRVTFNGAPVNPLALQ